MILEILIICIVFLLLMLLGVVWFSQRMTAVAIREGKSNVTININNSDKKPELEQMSDLLKTANLLLTSKEILKLEQKSKSDED